MNMRNVSLLALCAAVVIVAGCTGSQTASGVSALLPQSAKQVSPLRPNRRSWMDGGVAKQDLLYVTNGDGEVTVYRYWQHTLVGVLTAFTQPMGECADKEGDVFIADYAAKTISEYAHGGTKPFHKFDDAPDSPYACAVDPTTGNLAVANDDGASQEGNIATWSASGERTTYTDPTLYNFDGCAYDNKGNLLVNNGYRYKYGTFFAWLPANGTKLINVNVPGPEPSWEWGYVQGIQWDGKYFAIDDYNIYRITLTHGQAYYVGTTNLYGRGGNGPYWIYNNNPSGQGTQIVGGLSGDSGSMVVYFHYPAGGNPIAQITHGVDRPFGVAISLKKT